MTDNRVSYTLESTLDSVNVAEAKTDQLAAKHGFSDEDRHRLAMAVREAMVNAVLHGNAYDPKKKVNLSFEKSEETFVITVADQGKGLDPEDLPDPLASENLLKQSGRGIFLMRSFMDEVRIRNLHPGTEVTLVKKVGGTEAETTEEQRQ